MRTNAGAWAGLTCLLLAAGLPFQKADAMPSEMRSPPFEIPFDGPGRLLMVASRGPDRPQNYLLLVATRNGTAALPLESPSTAEWLSPSELIASRSAPGHPGEIVRLDREGHARDVLSTADLAYPRPAPDRRQVSVAHFVDTPERKGIGATEIRALDRDFTLTKSFSYRDLPTLSGVVVWSPDAKQLAVDLRSDEDEGRVRPRLGILVLENAVVRRLYDSAQDRERDESGVIPIFWTSKGLYARSQRGVLRCDPTGEGCTVVYDPGNNRRVLDGTPLGGDEVLLLIQDLQADPLEARAKEIHRLNLNTGKGGLFYRLPADAFASGIDWIGGD